MEIKIEEINNNVFDKQEFEFISSNHLTFNKKEKYVLYLHNKL